MWNIFVLQKIENLRLSFLSVHHWPSCQKLDLHKNWQFFSFLPEKWVAYSMCIPMKLVKKKDNKTKFKGWKQRKGKEKTFLVSSDLGQATGTIFNVEDNDVEMKQQDVCNKQNLISSLNRISNGWMSCLNSKMNNHCKHDNSKVNNHCKHDNVTVARLWILSINWVFFL